MTALAWITGTMCPEHVSTNSYGQCVALTLPQTCSGSLHGLHPTPSPKNSGPYSYIRNSWPELISRCMTLRWHDVFFLKRHLFPHSSRVKIHAQGFLELFFRCCPPSWILIGIFRGLKRHLLQAGPRLSENTTISGHASVQRFPKGGFCVGGEISIIGVVRAPVAIINVASKPCENLWL